MKFVRVNFNGNTSWGVVEGQEVRLLEGAPYFGINYSGKSAGLNEVALLAPCTPSKVVAVGKNYADHAVELGGEVPKSPIIFIKPETSINDPCGDIIYPAGVTRLDYEGELAFVIGKRASKVKAKDAGDYIFAYTCLNDVTARDQQASDGQWTRAKGYDSFCPVGPWLVQGIDPKNADIETRLNGEVRQKSNTSILMWDVFYLMEFITACMTLLPGDVVTTGTPAGIGPMKKGDRVEVEIGGIGVLTNTVV